MALCFALALAAKPMVVSLPILLLLWDYLPLQRLNGSETLFSQASLPFLIMEKLPLFALSAASSWITMYAQRRGGALILTDLLPLQLRLRNAIYSYAIYAIKGIWPSHLAVFYTHPQASLAYWKTAIAGLLIAGALLVAWRFRSSRRYLLVGWIWYLVAMFPMIGVVQVGRQSMADRYAYLPFLGLFLIAVWGFAELGDRNHVPGYFQSGLAIAILLAYASVS